MNRRSAFYFKFFFLILLRSLKRLRNKAIKDFCSAFLGIFKKQLLAP